MILVSSFVMNQADSFKYLNKTIIHYLCNYHDYTGDQIRGHNCRCHRCITWVIMYYVINHFSNVLLIIYINVLLTSNELLMALPI